MHLPVQLSMGRRLCSINGAQGYLICHGNMGEALGATCERLEIIPILLAATFSTVSDI